MTDIGDMSRRNKRLQEKGATQDADEGKTEDRRLSAGGVLGLNTVFCGDPLDDDDPYGSLTNGDYDYDHDG